MPDVQVTKGRRRANMVSCTKQGFVWMLASFTHVQTTIVDGVNIAGASFDLEVIDEVIKDFQNDGLSVEIEVI